MSGTNHRQLKIPIVKKADESGVAAVEFALVAIIFFLLVFGIIEFSRAMYMFNTLSEVTRHAARAAASISFTDTEALDLARKRAVIDEARGVLPLGSPITYQNIRIEYLYLPKNAISLQVISAVNMPNSSEKNRVNCMNDPNSQSCIRAIQARICRETADTGDCTATTFKSIIPLVDLSLKLPRSLTIVNAETLGYKPAGTL
jgi:Flp pilus assembly pilin Flp